MRLNEILALNKTVQGVVEEKGTLWRVHQSEATGRYHVVKGYNKNIKMFKNKIGAGDFTSKEAAQSKAKELNQGVAEGLNEMDKSAPQPGRDGKVSHSTYGSRDKKGSDYFKGKEAPGKPITKKQMEKDALDILKKQGVAEGKPDWIHEGDMPESDEELENFLDSTLPELNRLAKLANTSKQAKAEYYKLKDLWDAANSKLYGLDEQGVAEGKFGAQGLAQSLKKPGKTGGPGFDISAAEKRNAEFAEKLKAQAEEIHGRRLDDLARRYGAEVVATAYKKSGNNLDKTRAYLKSTYDDDMTEQQDQPINETAAWKRKEGKSKTGGLNKKGVASYRRENPGSKLQTAVTTKPSKLKPGSKAAKRRKSFCARMGGMKGPMKKPNGKPTRKALALRKWNCESIDRMVQDFENELNEIIEVKQRLDPKCWKGKHKEGTKIKGGIRVNNCVPNK